MIDLNQDVILSWTTRNVKTYKNKGYPFTKYGDDFCIKLYDLNKDANIHVDVQCDVCGIKYKTPYRNYNKIISKQGLCRCKSCTSKNNNTARTQKNNPDYYLKFVNACNEKGYSPVTTIDEMCGCSTEVKYICPAHGIIKTNLERLLNGSGCKKCSDEKNQINNRLPIDNVIEIVESKNNNRLINPEDYCGIGVKNLKIICGSCGKQFISSLSSINNGDGHCRDCANKAIGLKLIKTKADIEGAVSKIKGACIYNVDDYDSVMTKNLCVRCVKCGKTFLSSYAKYIDAGILRCKKCVSKSSYGEYYIAQYLTDHNIKFIQEHRFSDCKDKKPLPFDFYLPDINLCIEFDGIQHERPVRGYKSFSKTKVHDKTKNEYCLNKGINLLRIPSREFNNIDKILDRELQFV